MSIEEKIDQAKGAAKEGVGKLTGDKKIEKEGAAEKAAAKGKEVAEDVKDVDGNVVCTKGTVITNEVIDTLRPVFEAGAHTVEMKTNPRLESNGVLQVCLLYTSDAADD